MSLINKETLTIGGDPEVFLVRAHTKEAVSAIGLVPGSKVDPYELPELGKGFALQTDCCSVEFNLPPVQNPTDFYENVQKMFSYIQSIVPAGLEISLQTSAEFTSEELEHPQAQLAGCSTDYNAWEMCANKKPNFAVTNVRCNGAHLHFGYEGFNDFVSMELIKALDVTLGVTLVLLDADTARRQLYGRAGCFRLTPFGVEYRTPSPAYLASRELVEYVFKAIDKAVDLVNSEITYSDEDQLKIQACINSSDPVLAEELIKQYQLEELLPLGVLFA